MSIPGLERHPAVVAPTLLGARLVSCIGPRVEVRITEVEGYAGVGEDPGSHAHRRRTPRNATMFGPVGRAYVYFTYGMHWCLNVVAHEPGLAGAVLLRAGEVTQGLAAARERRPAARSDRDLARGPARLAAALGVTGELDGADLGVTGELDGAGLEAQPVALQLHGVDPARVWAPDDHRILRGPRTGVAGPGAPTPWRFWLAGDPTVSPHRPAGRSAPRTLA
jgi:DNA-3-methyladenine glycosylase